MRCINRSTTLLVSAWVLGGLGSYALDGCVSVEGARILAADLAAAAPAFAMLPPDKDLGPAPTGTLVRVFQRSHLATLLPGSSSELPERVCVERKRTLITVDVWQSAIERSVASVCGTAPMKVKVVDAPNHRFPVGRIEFQRSGLAASRGSVHLWRGSLLTADKSSVPVWVRVEIETLRTALFLQRAVAAGALIGGGDYRAEEMWAPGLCVEADANFRPDGLVARRSLALGAELRKEALRPPPAVKRGQSVELEAAAGAARIRIPAVAERDAEVGETVALRSSWNGAKLAGRVTGNQKARVE